MIDLMRLELKKVKMRYFIGGILIIIVGLLFFANTSIYASVQETPKNSYSNILKLVNMAVTECFTIYGAVLISKVIISEYVNRSALIMLAYPINPKLWMTAKLLVISLFVMIGTFLGNMCCTLFIVFRDRYWDIVNGTFSLQNLQEILSLTIITMFLNGFLILFSFVVGMIKKSISATIVGSILMAFFLQILLTQTESRYQLILSGFVAILFLFIFSGIIFKTSIKSISATE